jgi:hypothetical protein
MMGYYVPHVMSETITADGGRTDTKRFDADDDTISATDLIVGDRIDPALVASTMDGLGRTRSPAPDAVPTQLAEATETDRMDDVHTAILVDGETGRMVIASRHDSQSAWSQKEADWKVRDVGNRVAVTDAEIARDDNNELSDADPIVEADAWANIVLQDRAAGATDYADRLKMTSRNGLSLHEEYNDTKIYANIELEPDD